MLETQRELYKMNLKKNLIKIAAFTSILTLNIGLFAYLSKTPVKVDAYNAASLPTTIDLNDCAETDIRNYYSDLNSLTASERQGTNLLKNLKTILSNNQKYYSYESGTKVWQMYEITDRDWEKSPASSTQYGTYNASTNKITNYSYGTGNNDGKNNPYIHALYINRNIENKTKAWGNHNQDAWGINREHIWAKSHGFDAEASGGARGDPMHLWAANGWANHEHSNYFFAFVDKGRTYSDAGSKYNTVYNNLTGYSKNAGGNQTVFEPQDCDKGDIARSVFYMVARYNNYAGATTGFDSNNPNLVMLNNLSENGRTGTSSATNPYGMGLLSDLLAWNKLDPVDDYEVHRNNLLYKNYTNNRNPFIDFPEWADAIWGTADLDGRNYNSQVSSVATPASDPIGSVASNEFDVSTKSINLQIGETADISAKNADGTVTWIVEDNSVVNLNKNTTTGNEKVTIAALDNGTTTVTATCGGDSASCLVTVSEATPINYGTQENPLSVSEAKALIDQNSPTLDMMYVKGIVSSSTYNSQYSNFDNVYLEDDDGEPFDLYHVNLDSSITNDYTAQNALVGKEVIAYGYGKKYNSVYELAPQNNNYPVILSVKTPGPVEKTPAELVEEKTTSTMLSYRYTKTNGQASATDMIDAEFTERSGTTYGDWTKNGASGVTYTGQSAAGNNAVQLRSSSNSGVVVKANTGANVRSVTVVWNSNTSSGRTIDVYGKSTAYSSPSDLYGNNQGTKLGSIVCGTSTSLTITGDYKFIGFRSNSGALWLDSIEIEWGGSSKPTYSYSDVSIRFGAVIEQDLWNNLDTEDHFIAGFGVMIASTDVLDDGMHIKDFCDSAAPAESNPDVYEELVDYYKPIEDMPTPVTNKDGDYYWNLFYRLESFTDEFVAAAYIKLTNDEFVFLQEVRYSVKTLAADYLANRDCGPETAGGSLANLAK